MKKIKFSPLIGQIAAVIHTEDRNFASCCSGWAEAHQKWPEIVPVRLSLEERNKWDSHGEWLDSLNLPEEDSISAPEWGAILLAHAEFLFLLLGQQAERHINTNSAEQKLSRIKDDLKLLSEHKDGQVVMGIANWLSPKLNLRELAALPPDCKHTWRGLPAYPLHDNYVVVVEPVNPSLPRLEMGYDGKNLIAVHPRKLPPETLKLLSGGDK